MPPSDPEDAVAVEPEPPPPKLDALGRYHAHGTISAVTVGVYAVIILLLFVLVLPSSIDSNPTFVYVLAAGTAFLLLRYATTSYTIDDTNLVAWRILGPRRMPLRDVRKIEFLALRDLSPTGFFGSWGYRGRMWSPYVQTFDAIYTDPVGILVSGGAYPLFISPRNPEEFARELSRRVRSYSGELTVDVGAPRAAAAGQDF